MNTAVSATTKKSPFQLLYGFNPNHALDIIAGSVDADADWATLRELYRKEAHVAIVNAQAAMARYMDKRSTPLSLAVGDKVYLRLHHGYTLPSTVKAKIGQQRAGPFPIDAIIGKNAYRLRLPSTWKIWPVISVVFLEPATAGEDPFARTPPPAPAVVVEGDVDDSSYEVSAIVKKRYNRRRRTTEYLVRWKDYGAEHDQWFDEDELHHCRQLVFEYETAVGNAEWRPRDDPTWKPETESEQGEVNRDADMHGSSSMRRSSQLAV